MSDRSIKNLADLLRKATGPTMKLVSSSVKRLTAPGENYLGIVLKVDAVLRNERNEEENFSAVAKCLNFDQPEFMVSTIPIQYKKEYKFYSEIVPTLEEFQKEIGLEERGITDVFPKLYTARCSLDVNSEEPDEDAVLLFENLGEKGYTNADRVVGFDLEGAKLLLKDLAAFHAIPLALKLKKPDVFENKIQKHLSNVFSESGFDGSSGEEKLEDIWYRVLEPFDEVKPYLETLREKLSKSEKEYLESLKEKAPEPFATISHTDLWTNNTMQIFRNGKPVENKFIDFQLYTYGSPAQDLIFFLWSSIPIFIVQENFDDLIKFYHDHFINLLDKCGCDTTPFRYGNFLKEIDDIAKKEIFNIMYMQVPIFGKKGESAFDDGDSLSIRADKISELARQRTAVIVSTFIKRGWL